jgi:hypothetical protein
MVRALSANKTATVDIQDVRGNGSAHGAVRFLPTLDVALSTTFADRPTKILLVGSSGYDDRATLDPGKPWQRLYEPAKDRPHPPSDPAFKQLYLDAYRTAVSNDTTFRAADRRVLAQDDPRVPLRRSAEGRSRPPEGRYRSVDEVAPGAVYEYFVDDTGLVHKLVVRHFKDQIDSVVQWTAFGAPVTIAAPPASQTSTMADLFHH